MPEVIFNGADGRLEGRYHHATERDAPLAVVLHPHPLHGGTMNNRIVYDIYHMFVKRGFSVLRFNFRGVGRSQESFDHGQGELRDAAAALDWMQLYNPNAKGVWVAGISFGAWIGMQLLMRRPEIQGFISAALPANLYDFSFLAPCPSSGLIVNGDRDTLVTVESVEKLVEKLKLQRGLEMGLEIMPGADHFFTGYLDRLNEVIEDYLDMRLAAIAEEAKAPTGRKPAKAKPATDKAVADDAEEADDQAPAGEDDAETEDEIVAKAG
ncbi:MAG: alpha/beta hydrolase [Alphaproteobacteria bacterium]|nr:alpha/beta hydrolase [Alphaproteobacteria bacterium]